MAKVSGQNEGQWSIRRLVGQYEDQWVNTKVSGSIRRSVVNTEGQYEVIYYTALRSRFTDDDNIEKLPGYKMHLSKSATSITIYFKPWFTSLKVATCTNVELIKALFSYLIKQRLEKTEEGEK